MVTKYLYQCRLGGSKLRYFTAEVRYFMTKVQYFDTVIITVLHRSRFMIAKSVYFKTAQEKISIHDHA